MMNSNRANYVAFLVRLWQEDAHTWRGMLENPHTGEKHHFAGMEELFQFLRVRLQQAAVGHGERET